MPEIAETVPTGRVEGAVAPGFEPLADAFLHAFREQGEHAASCHLKLHGETVVDLWGGAAEDGTPHAEDSLCLVWSCTKTATAAVVHLLAERGKLDLDAPAADHWPELAAEGKGAITPRMMLDHTAGLPVFTDPVPGDIVMDHPEAARRLAAQAPLWAPGTRTGYHALTYGVLLGELVRRADGRTLGTVFAEEIAAPFGLDVHIGAGPEAAARALPTKIRVSDPDAPETPFIRESRTRGTISNLFVFNSGDWGTKRLNTPEGRAAEIPAAGGLANARGLAGLFAALLDPNGPLRPETVAGFSRCSSATHDDATLHMATRFGPGFMLEMHDRRTGDRLPLPPRAFGHTGAGGSVVFADPDTGAAFAYAMTRMANGLLLNTRSAALVTAWHACMAARA